MGQPGFIPSQMTYGISYKANAAALQQEPSKLYSDHLL